MVLAIDPGSRETGWAYKKNGVLTSGVISARSKDLTARILVMKSGIRNLFYENEFTEAVIEIPEFFYTKTIRKIRSFGDGGRKSKVLQSLLVLAQVTGALRAECFDQGAEVRAIGATKWNKTMTKADKMLLTGKSDHNEADAICLLKWWEAEGKFLKWR